MSTRAVPDKGTLPYWIDSASLPAFAQVEHDIDVDVVVVGAGITGLTTAYLLASAGRSVVVIERGRCAEIDTGHTTAHLTMVTDTQLNELVNKFGASHAQALWDAGRVAIDEIERIVDEHAIDCSLEVVDGYLHAPAGALDARQVDSLKEDARLAREFGFDAEFIANVPFAGRPGVRFANQARFHPRKYLAGLVQAIRAAGGEIFEHSGAEEFLADPIRVKANGHTLKCKDIVIATHNPIAGIASSARADLFQTKLALYTSYVVAGRVTRETVPDALFWDTADPYHYLRTESHRDHQLIIFGGEDHKTGQASDTNECFKRLERKLFAALPGIAIRHRWSGQVIETPDGLPYIGAMTDHQYAATGFAGNGMTFGTLAGIMIVDAIEGRRNPWADLFDPARKAIRRGLWDYVKENADYPYYMARGTFERRSRSLRSLQPGQGAVVDDDGTKVAAFRRDDGTLALRSAVCTHMGCTVGWNDAERTWDCPCHGSRFTAEGDVISGPAQSPLEDVSKTTRAATSR
jgi:glycine/D-amino acid oxidase-like deaminating enzyme/nitrite reductase/ring-hydroxylating ferredoxin subunit